jgi:hypothetical protein
MPQVTDSGRLVAEQLNSTADTSITAAEGSVLAQLIRDRAEQRDSAIYDDIVIVTPADTWPTEHPPKGCTRVLLAPDIESETSGATLYKDSVWVTEQAFAPQTDMDTALLTDLVQTADQTGNSANSIDKIGLVWLPADAHTTISPPTQI